MKKAKSSMGTKNGVHNTTSYEDFEPFCNWYRENDHETVVIHLPGFEKDQLKLQLVNRKILKVSGEFPVNGKHHKRFYKEIRLPNNCKTDDIRAKFVGGLLQIAMPKMVTLTPNQEPAQYNLRTKQDQQVVEKPSLDEISESDGESDVSLLENLSRIARNVAVVTMVVTCLCAYVVYSYRAFYVEVDC